MAQVKPLPARERGKKPKPLTTRAHDALIAHGPATADALAKRLRAKSRAVSKALSGLKKSGRAKFTLRQIGEPVWRAVKTPSRKAPSGKIPAALGKPAAK